MNFWFDLLIIAVLCIVFLISCCGLLTKLRLHHEEVERGKVMQNRSPEGSNTEQGSGIFPSSFAPPPYIEFDLPPKYEEVIKCSKDMPKVHQSDLEGITIRH